MALATSITKTHSFTSELDLLEKYLIGKEMYLPNLSIFSRLIRSVWLRPLIMSDKSDEKNNRKKKCLLNVSELKKLGEPVVELMLKLEKTHEQYVFFERRSTAGGGGMLVISGGGGGGGSVQNMQQEMLDEAVLFNDLYRIVSRTVQALQLLIILLRAQESNEGCISVGWSKVQDW